jgi:ribonuclease D
VASYFLIETNQQLKQVCDELCGEKELALDLEADSLHHYREKVCLLQLSNRHSTWLIDPLLVTELSPLAVLLADQRLLTVFHGGDYDVRSLHRDFGISVAQMYDTMVAAQFVGISEFGLAALLRSFFGIELDKRFQKADWSKRPLSSEMADYAAADTSNLLQLADLLREKLQELGRSDWVAEECSLVASNRMTEKGDRPLFLHCKGAGKLQRRNLAILEELLQFRDQQARELDRPPFKVLAAETLLSIAEMQVQNVREMNGLPGLTPRLLGRYGLQLVAAVQRGLALPDQDLPRYPHSKGDPNPGIKARVAELKQWRQGSSKQLELSSGLIAPNWLLDRIAEQCPTSLEELAGIAGIRRWQVSQWGQDVVTMLAQGSRST